MLVSADLKCYYCGFVSGEVVADTTRNNRILRFKPIQMGDQSVDATSLARGKTRCLRCGGPVFLDDPETISERRFLLENEALQAMWDRQDKRTG